jgi:hypothetical protein
MGPLYALPRLCQYLLSFHGLLSADSRVPAFSPSFSSCYPLYSPSRPDISHMGTPLLGYGFLITRSAYLHELYGGRWPTFSSVYLHHPLAFFSAIPEPYTDRCVFFMLTALQAFLTTYSA